MRSLLLTLVVALALVGMFLTTRQPASAYVRDGWYQLHDTLVGDYRVTVLSTDDDTACLAIVQGQGVAALDNTACDGWRAQPFTPAQEQPSSLREVPASLSRK